MPVKVSVVVPVYNPGEYLEPCIRSLLGQSLPADELELVFVDDGSTDATPRRLDELAAAHPQVRVIHQENSGWPGRPRNVGTAAATGEYVQYVDQDDELREEALERLYDYGRRNEADIVIGKMAGVGRGAPVGIFRRNRESATLFDSPIISSLTPHKMFRRDFLAQNGLAFPEGRRRLEDHVFVVAAYFAARHISVLADYVCYVHNSRSDQGNAASSASEPRDYFANLCDALDVVDANTQPGPDRDRLHRRWLRHEMMGRLRGKRFLNKDGTYQRKLFDAIRGVILERFALGVDAGLAPIDRIVAGLVRGDNFEAVVLVARWEQGLDVIARLKDASWRDGALALTVEAQLVDADGAPVSLTVTPDGHALTPPLPAQVLDALGPQAVDVGELSLGLDVVMRHAPTGSIIFQASHKEPTSGPTLHGVLRAEVRLDGSPPAGPLTDAVWEVAVRFRAMGWTFTVPVTRPRDAKPRPPGPALVGQPIRSAVPFWTKSGNLRVDVGGASPRTAQRLQPDLAASTAAVVDGHLVLEVDLPAALDTPQPTTLRLTHHDGGVASVDAPATLEHAEPSTAGGHSRVRARIEWPRLSPGRWRLSILPPDPAAARDQPLGAIVVVAGDAATLQLERPDSRQTPTPSPRAGTRPGLVSRVPGAIRRRLRRWKAGIVG